VASAVVVRFRMLRRYRSGIFCWVKIVNECGFLEFSFLYFVVVDDGSDTFLGKGIYCVGFPLSFGRSCRLI
jgi:hypothetical protein